MGCMYWALPAWLVFVLHGSQGQDFPVLSSQGLPAMWITNKLRDTQGKFNVIVMTEPFPPGWALSQCY